MLAAAGVAMLGSGGGGLRRVLVDDADILASEQLQASHHARFKRHHSTPPPAHKIPPAPMHLLAPPADLFDAGVEDTPHLQFDLSSFAAAGTGQRPLSTIGFTMFFPPTNSSSLPPTQSPPNSSTLPSAVGISRFPHQPSLAAPVIIVET
ncbi:hypothetical protein PENSPDRAFT_100094 [Peniophora sp. CONT]|nr:hypothetical protein PENSPDRAFT_100094 [Peniophora sp. CONT]